MKRSKGFTLIELLVVIAIIAVLAAILFPVFARARRAAQASNCQSNMKQIGNAVKMYLSDWDDTYMTNRARTTGALAYYQALSPSDPIPPATEPPRFQYSINWVEGLYNYVESVTKSSDPQSVWRCGAASNKTWPTSVNAQGYPYPAVNYVFNYNLVEQPEGIIKGASNLMMIREFWLTTIAQLRPTNVSVANQSSKPLYPFHNGDAQATPAENGSKKTWQLHANGSHILFADGHVRGYDTKMMPSNSEINATMCWDGETQQWFNFAPSATGVPENYKKQIAITP